MRILSSAQVDNVLAHFTVHDYLDLSRKALEALSYGQAMCPPRHVIEHKQYTSLHMPSQLKGVIAEKIVGVPHKSSPAGLDASIIILDQVSGAVECIMNAKRLTAIRTASASLAATLLLKNKNSQWEPKTLVIFGSGEQAYQHVKLHLKALGSLKRVAVVGRSWTARFTALLEQLKTDSPSITISGHISKDANSETDCQQLLTEADIICCCTPSTVPLFSHGILTESVKIRQLNLIGSYKPSMMEVEPEVFRAANSVLVDTKEGCMAEAGELIAAIKAGYWNSEDVVELGTVYENAADAHTMQDRLGKNLSIFKSVGSGAMDNTIAQAVLAKSEALSIGTVILDY